MRFTHYWAVMFFMLTTLGSARLLGDPVSFLDTFKNNTTPHYQWFEEGNGGDNNPTNNFTYDPRNKWVTITTADNCNIYMGSSLPEPISAGFFQFSFMPFQVYPTDGLVRMRVFGTDGTSYMYMWHFAHNSNLPDAGVNDGYRAHLEKWVDGIPIIEEVFIPSPSSYALDTWHTLSMTFSPTVIAGYLDGQLIRTAWDPMGIPIAIDSFEIVFQQQDQHVDDIIIIASAYSVPVRIPAPAGILLASLGVATVGWLRRQRRV